MGYTLVKGKEKLVGVPTSIYVDIKKESMAMNLEFERLKEEDQIAGEKSFLNSQKFAVVIPEVTKEKMENEIILFGQKIIYELCYYMWGISFLQSPDAQLLRRQLLKGKVLAGRKLALNEDDPLVSIENESRSSTDPLGKTKVSIGNQTESKKKVSPFENFPHVTFVIMRYPSEKWFALVNLFDYEITTNLFNLDEEVITYLKKKGGIVLVIETLKGKNITLFPLEQYLKTRTG